MERDESLGFDLTKLKDFNSHAHVERDATLEVFIVAPEDFNSHAHVERDIIPH